MSIAALDLLRTLDLLGPGDVVQDLERQDDKTLAESLTYYHLQRERDRPAEITSAAQTSQRLTAVRGRLGCSADIRDILPSAFVYDRIFIDDPVYRRARQPQDADRACAATSGIGGVDGVNRERLTQSLDFMAEISPLIRDGVIVTLPLGDLHDVSGRIPICFSPDRYASAIPAHVRSFVASSVQIETLSPASAERGLNAASPVSLAKAMTGVPTRGIAVGFADDRPHTRGPLYLLYDVISAERLGGDTFRIGERLDWDKRPDVGIYRAWVEQSVNRAIVGRLNDIAEEMAFAADVGACYVTESGFEARLVGLSSIEEASTGNGVSAVNFLSANAPFLKIDSAAAIAKIRRDNPQVFEKFQASLLHVASELSGTVDGFDTKAKGLYLKEIEPQVQAVNAQLGKTIAQGIASFLISSASIGLALLRGSATPMSITLAVAGGAAVLQTTGGALPSAAEYLMKRRTPAFIWAQISR